MNGRLLQAGFLAVLAVAVVLLREQTMTRETTVDPDTRLEVVVAAHTVREPDRSALEMTLSLVSACKLLVESSLVQEEFQEVADRTFRFVFVPSLDRDGKARLHGCLQDARLQHLQLRVLEMTEARLTA